ncbi:hypothetical protein ENC19_09800 [Verrucosispora sp. CWR15]|uniref:Uncharacterized protein n=1 Tax=Verrucosispora sioxanthis TaxID=2499994 RepID=A0A6M1L2R9_9ACTN|nr:hypothetical protein [Verrucosispora sioxanthis]NEE63821.1 hypothetical protein [Verrucosispora sioxanthis]NGM12931.1 hypothetical protein [Verrucosispora sioxanthis]
MVGPDASAQSGLGIGKGCRINMSMIFGVERGPTTAAPTESDGDNTCAVEIVTDQRLT